MSKPLQQLEERLGKITDLERISRVLSWDQQTMMPPAGSDHRADHLATLRRIAHELLIADETRGLLDELRPLEESLEPDSDDAALIRVARRDYEKAVRVPTDLRAEMTRAAAQARPVWVKAKAESNFELFLPALERNVELRRRYVACFDDVEEPYDILLDDFEPYTTTAEVREIFDELKAELASLIAELGDSEVDDSFLSGSFPIDRQERLAKEVVELFGFRPDTWRLDPTEHPFASGAGVDDVRITTHYDPETMKSFFSTMHEYGHGLYSHQLRRDLQRLPTGNACSLGIHESQSRLWENLVGRSPQFWRFFYPRVQETYPEQLSGVALDRFVAGINRVKPSLIRIKADEVTYGMHIILRFELEQDIINGRVELRDLPQVWNERMHDYLGVDVPDDVHGVLQDTHWASGLIGYFATYLLGSVMSVQIWEKALEDVPDLEDQVERGEFAALRDWLGEHVHAQGRKFSPQDTLERATGSRIDAKPYLAYLRAKYRAGVAA
ncbi:MAG: carboxypeptidase M32 [Actinomycetota bacterium]|nr:carboxypeptidase M32 [Actinomycetota bacterium]